MMKVNQRLACGSWVPGLVGAAVSRTFMPGGLLVLGLVCASCGERLEKPDPYNTLNAASSAYCGVQAYQIVSNTRITPGTRQAEARTIRLAVAAGRGGRLRREITFSPGTTSVQVSDGLQEWTFFPDRNQYVLAAPGAGPVETGFEDVAGRLCGLGDAGVRDVRWLRAERVRLEGKPIMCDVIRISPTKTCWIGREQHRVLREEEVYRDGLRETTEYELVHLGEEPPAQLFACPVSRGATRIESPIAKGTSPDSTWLDRYEVANSTMNAAQDELQRFHALGELGKAACEIGKIDAARQWAREELKLATRFRGDWHYGNAIHDGHMVLGRIALREGNLAAARRELIEAGKTPGSPQLDSYGPNMSLAKDLLERNETDVVEEYLKLCGSFWDHKEKLRRWKAVVSRGGVPDFGRNLRY